MKEPGNTGRAARVLGTVALLVGGAMVGLALAEAALRWWSPQLRLRGGHQLFWIQKNPDYRPGRYMIDPDLGFRPVLGNELYNRFGTLVNDYPEERRPGIQRLLFVGDSVTVRGVLLAALRRELGNEGYEYWNAGVDSYGTIQEIRFYRRYNAPLDPDHVIMIMHNNDVGTTPVAFQDDQGRFMVFAPNRPARLLSRWLFSRSHLYRLLVNVQLGLQSADPAALQQEIREELAGFARELRDAGTRFSVILLPILKPLAEWRPHEVRNYRAQLGWLEELGIRHFDLLPPMEKALADGVDVQQARGDFWHPSAAVCAYFARHLAEQRLLPQTGEGSVSVDDSLWAFYVRRNGSV